MKRLNQTALGRLTGRILAACCCKASVCLLCLARCRPGPGLCSACMASLPVAIHSCQRCREPVAAGVSLCPCCRQRERLFQHCVAPLLYTGPVAGLIKQAKYGRQLLCIRPLTTCLERRLAADYSDTGGDTNANDSAQALPQALVPVPLHWWKLRRRGFNLASLVAQQLGRRWQLPVLHSRVARTAATRNQQGLSARDRQHNVRRAFRITKPVPFSHLALIDDVLTTGATAESLCRTLHQQGVRRVDLWCLARTPARSDHPTGIAAD